MQKHSGICLFLVAAEFKHNTGGNATLSINAYLGATLPMSFVQTISKELFPLSQTELLWTSNLDS